MTTFFGALVSLCCLLAAQTAQAQPYPSKQITLVVTAAAGGVTDVVARAIGQRLGGMWGPPGEITYGTAGVGSAPHVNIVKFENMAHVKLQPIHYRGAAPALNDIMAGHINLMSVSYSLVVQPLAEKKLKVLGVGGTQRSPQLPNAPTVAESVPGYEANTWFGLAAPGGTPREVVMKINADVRKILAEPAFQQRIRTPQRL